MKKFWNWVKNEEGNRTLYLEGAIAQESWYGDEVTPKQFRSELFSNNGDITIWINSPGGDVFAAAQIYNMLMEYRGHVTVKINSLAASAASVIAMAGSKVVMSPVAMLMIHNPMTFAFGDSEEMQKAKGMLDEVKESIINAYELKTGMSRVKLAHLMNDESWFNAKKAVELGFADEIMYQSEEDHTFMPEGVIFSRLAVTNSILSKLPMKQSPVETKIPIAVLDKRLDLLKH